jgi:membrane-associated protease RseP (regulator of RpoE activity)
MLELFEEGLKEEPKSLPFPDKLDRIVYKLISRFIYHQGGRFIGASSLNWLPFTGLISLNLGLLNLFPVPALDGGKILLYLLEKIHPKMLRFHLPLSIAGWLFILGLMIYVTINDIGRYLC